MMPSAKRRYTAAERRAINATPGLTVTCPEGPVTKQGAIFRVSEALVTQGLLAIGNTGASTDYSPDVIIRGLKAVGALPAGAACSLAADFPRDPRVKAMSHSLPVVPEGMPFRELTAAAGDFDPRAESEDTEE